MNNQFTFEFNQLLKSVQLKPIRILIETIISFTLVSLGEFSFFSTLDKMQIVGCSNENSGSSSILLDNCFDQGFKLTTCLNQQFNTGSNYSLSFTVSEIGTSNDKYSLPMISLAIILFLSVMLVYQIAHYFQIQKRKRIQNILSQSLIFIDGNKKNEKIISIYFLVFGILYIIFKMVWIYFRDNEYGNIDCEGSKYTLVFQNTLSSYIGNLIISSLFFIFLPLMYIGGFINYLSDLDLKKITLHLSNDSIKQFKDFTIITPQIYNQVVRDAIKKKYSNNNSFLNMIFRINTFSFHTTSTSEIVEILQAHKKQFPQDFEPMLYNESKLLFNDIKTDDHQIDDKVKLLN